MPVQSAKGVPPWWRFLERLRPNPLALAEQLGFNPLSMGLITVSMAITRMDFDE
jgi:hypothetical protein